MSEYEVVVKALSDALTTPQEITCVSEAAARRLRFAIYGIRREMAEAMPGVLSIVVKVRGDVVRLERPPNVILSVRPTT